MSDMSDVVAASNSRSKSKGGSMGTLSFGDYGSSSAGKRISTRMYKRSSDSSMDDGTTNYGQGMGRTGTRGTKYGADVSMFSGRRNPSYSGYATSSSGFGSFSRPSTQKNSLFKSQMNRADTATED